MMLDVVGSDCASFAYAHHHSDDSSPRQYLLAAAADDVVVGAGVGDFVAVTTHRQLRSTGKSDCWLARAT